MTCLFALGACDFLFILEFSNTIWVHVRVDRHPSAFPGSQWHLRLTFDLTVILTSSFVFFFNSLSQYRLLVICPFYLSLFRSLSPPCLSSIVLILGLDASSVAFTSVLVLFFICFFLSSASFLLSLCCPAWLLISISFGGWTVWSTFLWFLKSVCSQSVCLSVLFLSFLSSSVVLLCYCCTSIMMAFLLIICPCMGPVLSAQEEDGLSLLESSLKWEVFERSP